jgi:hypothetical protein
MCPLLIQDMLLNCNEIAGQMIRIHNLPSLLAVLQSKNTTFAPLYALKLNLRASVGMLPKNVGRADSLPALSRHQFEMSNFQLPNEQCFCLSYLTT